MYPREAIRTDEIDDRDYRKFEETNTFHCDENQLNEFKLNTIEVKQLDRTNNTYLYETISAVLSVVKGFTIPQNIEDVNIVNKKDFITNKRCTILHDLCQSDTSNTNAILGIKAVFLTKEEEELYQELMEEYPVESIIHHKKYHTLMKGGESDLINMNEINNNVMILASLVKPVVASTKPEVHGEPKVSRATSVHKEAIVKKPRAIKPHHSIVGAKIKASCIVASKVILVFSASFHLCSLVQRLNPDKKVYSVSLTSFVVHEIIEHLTKSSGISITLMHFMQLRVKR